MTTSDDEAMKELDTILDTSTGTVNSDEGYDTEEEQERNPTKE